MILEPKIKYSIKFEYSKDHLRNRWFLRSTTGDEESFHSKEAAKEALKLWALEDKYRAKSYGDFKDRLTVARAFIRAGQDKAGSRIWDNCFEAEDGDKVAAAIGLSMEVFYA